MRPSVMVTITTAILIVVLAGCSDTGHAEDGDDATALPVAIFFPESNEVPVGDVLCDGKTVVHWTPPDNFALQLQPGEHTLSFRDGAAQKLSFERGRLYFFIGMAPKGGIFLSSRGVYSALGSRNPVGHSSFRNDLTVTSYKGIPMAQVR